MNVCNMNYFLKTSDARKAILVVSGILFVMLGSLNVTFAKSRAKVGANVPQFVYVVVDDPTNRVFQFRVQPEGALTPLDPVGVATGKGPLVLAADSAGRFLYVGNGIDNSISQYRISPNGVLVPLSPSTLMTGNGTDDIKITPNGRFVYVVNAEGNSISQYRIQANGTLVPLSPATISPGPLPISMSIDPTGRFAYVLVENRGEPLGYGSYLMQYRIKPDGQLQPLSPPVVADKGIVFPSNITLGPHGRFAYVAGGNDIIVYKVKPDGTLQLVQFPGIKDKKDYFATVDPQGRFVFALKGSGLVHAFIQPDGTLQSEAGINVLKDGTLMQEAIIEHKDASSLVSLAFNPNGHVLYLLNAINTHIFEYHVDADGTLKPLVPVAVPVGRNLSGLDIFHSHMIIVQHQKAGVTR